MINYISIYGAGYVGLVSAACFAKLGHYVMCADVDPIRIERLLNGECPIHEAGLKDLLQEQVCEGRISFTSNLLKATAHSNLHFITVGTPSLSDGSADLSHVITVSDYIVEQSSCDQILIVKSTVPVGTGDELEKKLRLKLLNQNKLHTVHMISNPEFLREGSAVDDFLYADRIIIGGDVSQYSFLQNLYQPMINRGVPIQFMSRVSAELTKYTANAMLACKISFMNQISRIADKVNANIDDVRLGISLDHRIGPHFLQAGIGYGGSCFPKDVSALVQTAKKLKVDSSLLESIHIINQLQKKWVVEQLITHFGEQIEGLKIGIWGLAFKPDTDDIREATSLFIINFLLKAGASLRIYDPIAMSTAKKILQTKENIFWCESASEVISVGIDALVIATEWNIFKEFPLEQLRSFLGLAPVIDGRNCFNLDSVKTAGLLYYSVGRPPINVEEN